MTYSQYCTFDSKACYVPFVVYVLLNDFLSDLMSAWRRMHSSDALRICWVPSLLRPVPI